MGVDWLRPGFTWLAAIRESERFTGADVGGDIAFEAFNDMIESYGGDQAGTYGIFEARLARHWFVDKIDGLDVRASSVKSHTYYGSNKHEFYGGPPYSVVLCHEAVYGPGHRRRLKRRTLSCDDAIEGPSHIFVPKVSMARKEPNTDADPTRLWGAIVRPSGYHMARAAEHGTTDDIMVHDCARSDLELLGLRPPRRATHVVSVHYTVERYFFLPDFVLGDQPPPCAADLDVRLADDEDGRQMTVLMYGDHEVCSAHDSLGEYHGYHGSTALVIQRLTTND